MAKIKLGEGDSFEVTAKDVEEERIELGKGVWIFLADDVRSLYKLLCKIVFNPKRPRDAKRFWDIR